MTHSNLHYLLAGFDLSLLDDAKIKARSAMRHEQCCHLRFVHADADPIAGDARLRHFKDGTPDAITIPDANLAVGQSVDGEILPELPIAEIASTKLGLPIPVRVDLVDKDRPMLAAMPHQIPLSVAVDVEPPSDTTALNGGLPDRDVDRLPSPRDIARQTHIHRK